MRNLRKYAATLGSVMAVGGLLGGAGCSGSTEPNPGALIVAVQTDLTAPKDVTAVGLYISSDGRPIFSDTRDTAPDGDVHFPATLAVIADSAHPSAVIKIRAVAYTSDNKVRVLRDAITTVPSGRSALLRMPLLWINAGSGTGTRPDKSTVDSLRVADLSLDQLSGVQGTCLNETDTYLVGACGSAAIDSSTLPDYVQADVFGGGSSDGTGGTCFDAKSCFEASTPLTLDANCSAPVPSGVVADDPSFTLGVAVSETPAAGQKTAGACLGNGSCIVPLDPVLEWNVVGGKLQIDPVICTKIGDGAALGVVATRACASKSLATPLCGPASAVQTSSADDAGSIVASPFDFDGSVSMTTGGDDTGGDAEARDAGGSSDATPTSDADADDATTTMSDGSTPSDGGGGGVDGSSDGGHTTADGGDGGTNVDAGLPNVDFGPVTTFAVNVPGPTNLRFDGLDVYFSQTSTMTQPARVAALTLGALIMTPAAPGTPVDYFAVGDGPSPAPAPVFDLVVTTGKPSTTLAAVFGLTSPFHFYGCPAGVGGCTAEMGLTGGSVPTSVLALALTPSRLYVLDGSAAVHYYDFVSTNTWSSFTLTGGVSATAIHFMAGSQQLVIGQSNGNLYSCIDAPCSATNGANLALAGNPGHSVSGIADDGNAMYFAETSGGVFRSTGASAVPLVSSTLISDSVTPLAVDTANHMMNVKYLYFGNSDGLFAAPLDGSKQNTPVPIVQATSPITSILSTGPEVFYSTPGNGTTAFYGVCTRYENATCQ